MPEEKKDDKTVIVDFDKFEEQKRIAIICKQRIDVTRLPTRSTLALAQFSDDLAAGKYNNEEQFMKLVDLSEKVMKPLCPTLTADKLLDETTYPSLKAFLDFVTEPLTKAVEEDEKEEGETGNPQPVKPE